MGSDGIRAQFLFPAAFEAQEKKKLHDDLASYNKHLDDEMEREKEKHKRNLDALNKRKEDMIKEKKDKLKVNNFPLVSIVVFTK
jgi:flavin-dependent dehydrogenase